MKKHNEYGYQIMEDVKSIEKGEIDAEFLKNPVILLIKYLEDLNFKIKILNEDSKDFYKNFCNDRISFDHGFLAKYEIKKYNNTIHYDSQSFKEDLTSKTILKDLVIWFENKNIENISGILHIINELDRNIRNHSGFIDTDQKKYYFSIQQYPNINAIAFTFIDNGQGFEKNLKEKFLSEYKELNLHPNTSMPTYACRKGLTTKSNWGELDKNDFGKNSGYGLYMLHQICCDENNSLKISSGGNIYKLKHNTKSKTLTKETSFLKEELKKVTMISAYINLDNIDELLQNIEKEEFGKSTKSKFINLSKQEIIDIINN